MSTIHFSDPVALANLAIRCVGGSTASYSGKVAFRSYCSMLATISQANADTFNAHYGENVRGITADEIAKHEMKAAMSPGNHLADALRTANLLRINVASRDADVLEAMCAVMGALVRVAAEYV